MQKDKRKRKKKKDNIKNVIANSIKVQENFEFLVFLS